MAAQLPLLEMGVTKRLTVVDSTPMPNAYLASPGLIRLSAGRLLNHPNRRGTDPYVRW